MADVNIRYLTTALAVAALASGCAKETTEAAGTVRDVEGNPLPGATVSLWMHGEGYGRAAPKSSTSTDADGRYRVSFTNTCGFVDCAFGGDLVADADGHEGMIVDIPTGGGHTVDFALRGHDELPIETTGIPDEQPVPVVDATWISVFKAEPPPQTDDGLLGRRETIVHGVSGLCDAWVTEHGRGDQLDCTRADGEAFDTCFLPPGAERVLCSSDGLYGGHSSVRFELAPDTVIPEGRPTTTTESGLPLLVRLAVDYRVSRYSSSCVPPTDPLFTNLGERIAYECDGARTTWLLGDLERAAVWTATRIGSTSEPAAGIVEESGRRTVVLQSVVR